MDVLKGSLELLARDHPIVTIDGLLDRFVVFASLLTVDINDPVSCFEYLTSLDLTFSGASLVAHEKWLVNHNFRIGKGKSAPRIGS